MVGKLTKLLLGALLLTTALFMAGCQKPPALQTTTTTWENITKTEVQRIDTVEVPGDTIVQTVYIECDSATLQPTFRHPTPRLKSDRASVKLDLKQGGLLRAECLCAPEKALIVVKDSIIHSMTALLTTVQPVSTKSDKEHPSKSWYSTALWGLGGLVVGAAVTAVFTTKLLRR